MLSPLASFSITFLIWQGVQSLRDVKLSVPAAVRTGQPITFNCNFQLEGDILYTVKWYRFQDEFYRYTPKENPPIKIFSVGDISESIIDKLQSNGTQLTLKKTTEAMSGTYSCEVSADAPSFQTATVWSNIIVVDPPRGKPTINGLKLRYKWGDLIHANCTAPGSRPAANITWTINDRMADMKHITERKRSLDGDLDQTISTIKIHARPHNFIGGRLRLKCTASIHQVYWQTTEKVVELQDKSQEGVNYGAEVSRGGESFQRGWSPSIADRPDVSRHTPLPPTEGLITSEDDILERSPNSSSPAHYSLQKFVLLLCTVALLLTFNQQ